MLNSTAKYRVEVTDESGNRIADVSDLIQNLKYTQTRNRADAISVDFDIDRVARLAVANDTTVKSIFFNNVNELHIYRNGTQIAAGQISWFNPKATAKEGRKVSIQATGWLELLAKRLTASSVTLNDDTSNDMQALIDYTQGLTHGDLGITIGTIQAAGQTTQRTYSYKNIRDAIIELSEIIGGPDFEFTPEKVFNTYSPRIGSHLTDISFTYPGNILELELQQDGTQMSNEIIALGFGTGNDQLKNTTDDTNLQATYGLRQEIVNFPDISVQATLDDHADEELRTKKTFFDIPIVTTTGDSPDLNDYSVGDDIEIKITKDFKVFESINGFFRVEQRTVSVDQNEAETVQIKFGKLAG